MGRSCARERLPEHPREQDCVTRPRPSLFRLRPFQPQLPVASSQLPEKPQNQVSVASSQLPENVRVNLVACAWGDRAKSERRKANSGAPKSLFWNILPITPTGSIFCVESFLTAFCFQYFARAGGRGVPASCQSPVVSCQQKPRRQLPEKQQVPRLLASLVARDDRSAMAGSGWQGEERRGE